jgi:succinate dehydrogenase/fumarate reductase flavoprotein subunit
LKGRRVFLDFRRNPDGFAFEDLSAEARQYLANSKALLDTPIARLRKMNPAAIALYRDHGIDIGRNPLEIAVCAQHNNGGLAANLWWESLNIRHLFPVGEVNGSHGVYRPGGSALNAGQVGGFRAAEFIAARYRDSSLEAGALRSAVGRGVAEVARRLQQCRTAGGRGWRAEREEFQRRMSRAGAHIRSREELRRTVDEARRQCERLEHDGSPATTVADRREVLRNRQLCLTHRVYLEAVLFAVESGVGSRGSAMVLDPAGRRVHEKLGPEWSLAPEDPAFRDRVQETVLQAGGAVLNRWVPRRPIPESDLWFETAWAAFRNGEIYGR